jgi:hypothetical protein
VAQGEGPEFKPQYYQKKKKKEKRKKLCCLQEDGCVNYVKQRSQTEKDKYHVFSHVWNLDLKKKNDMSVKRELFGGENQWEKS